MSKFFRAALFANAKKVDARLGRFETPTPKTDIIIFLSNKRLLVGTIHITFLIYLTAIYGQQMKDIDFSALAKKSRFCSIFPDRHS